MLNGCKTVGKKDVGMRAKPMMKLPGELAS
jgi:hypothetical protein